MTCRTKLLASSWSTCPSRLSKSCFIWLYPKWFMLWRRSPWALRWRTIDPLSTVTWSLVTYWCPPICAGAPLPLQYDFPLRAFLGPHYFVPSRSVKIADFGLSHAITTNPTIVTGARGTALFMAPEVSDGAQPSFASDIFSFGMTMWQALHPTVINPLGSTMIAITKKLDKGVRPPFTRGDSPLGLTSLGTCYV